MPQPPDATHPILQSLVERAQNGGVLKAEDAPLLPDDTKDKHWSMYACNVASEAQPTLYRAAARAIDAGLAFADLVAVVCHRDEPLAREDKARLEALGIDQFAFVIERNHLADKMEAVADTPAGVLAGEAKTYAHYRDEAAVLRAGPAAPGILRTRVFVQKFTSKNDLDTKLGEHPDPAMLRGQADAEDAWRTAKEAEIAAKAAALKAQQEAENKAIAERIKQRKG